MRNAVLAVVAIVSASFLLYGATAATELGTPWTLIGFSVPMTIVFLTLQENERLRGETRDAIRELADLIDLRDPYTHGHSQRVAAYSERLARRLGMSGARIELVREAARVHDIGKIGTPDHILRKPGPLDQDESVEMRRHAELSHRVLSRLSGFGHGADLASSHHERYDGTGYPHGHGGSHLPIEAAVISVADAYDAMTTDRPYRNALPWEAVRSELLEGRGHQWHPRIVDELVAMVEEDRRAAN